MVNLINDVIAQDSSIIFKCRPGAKTAYIVSNSPAVEQAKKTYEYPVFTDEARFVRMTHVIRSIATDPDCRIDLSIDNGKYCVTLTLDNVEVVIRLGGLNMETSLYDAITDIFGSVTSFADVFVSFAKLQNWRAYSDEGLTKEFVKRFIPDTDPKFKEVYVLMNNICSTISKMPKANISIVPGMTDSTENKETEQKQESSVSSDSTKQYVNMNTDPEKVIDKNPVKNVMTDIARETENYVKGVTAQPEENPFPLESGQVGVTVIDDNARKLEEAKFRNTAGELDKLIAAKQEEQQSDESDDALPPPPAEITIE
jgi:hypothetical protein